MLICSIGDERERYGSYADIADPTSHFLHQDGSTSNLALRKGS